MLRGDYEKGIEQLRRAYLLFPYNETLKHNLAEGYAAFGHQFFKQKKYDKADDNFVKAMELYPEEAIYALLRGICTYHLKKYDVARHELERAHQKQSETVEILYYLGLVYYETNNRQQAVELWEQGLKLSPSRVEFEELLKKARKEMAVEAGMDRGHSSRFDLTYDSGVNAAFALAVLDVLENAANQVGAELGFFPVNRVPVAIYTRADFKIVTDSPEWSGGVYDGTIRLPFGATAEVTPQMRAVLFHEYAHVVIFEMTRGNCPIWLNEGVAEMFGRKEHNRPMGEFRQAIKKKSYMDFRKMESGFSGLTTPDASLAYQQSYAMVNYMVTNYGWHRVNGILSSLGNGMNIDEAVLQSFQDYSITYDTLILEWQKEMEKSFVQAPILVEGD
ncbi:peptidase MA family metallohydrolase [Pelotalea chapellei]|uniref:Tetratricopeptide repeat protein n=1 Tax=Pelotalea chapellei TaxID=44671 RepID=A0ABS5U708_9BACT|nr:tetratricopeptide repeat protein [Pelotalea chapellei]MBT1071452.1 tetratricopeptide repeat protein [Pelotalea chapellei]